MKKEPLVSIIIPSYNYAHFITKAIESALEQDVNKEIIVVDDGSTDNTKQVVEKYAEVKYLYQDNKGLSGARNTGILNSTGEFIVFLDADDWYVKGGLRSNLNILLANPDCAMVVARHYKTFSRSSNGRSAKPFKMHVENAYYQLLKYNYVELIHAVMFRAKVIKEIMFDETLPSSEDHDIYFKIARQHKICHNETPVAVYFQHNLSMTSNIFRTLTYGIMVMEREKKYLKTAEEFEMLENGKKFMTEYYTDLCFRKLQNTFEWKMPVDERIIEELYQLKKLNPELFFNLNDSYSQEIKFLIKQNVTLSKEQISFLNEPEKDPQIRKRNNNLSTSYHKKKVLRKIKHILGRRPPGL